jgi:hypothetical protein
MFQFNGRHMNIEQQQPILMLLIVISVVCTVIAIVEKLIYK